MKFRVVQHAIEHALGLFLLGLHLFLLGSLCTFSAMDSSLFYHATQAQAYKNIFGFFGSYAASWCFYMFGYAAYLTPFCIVYAIALYYYMFVIGKISMSTEWDRLCGVILGFLSFSVLSEVYAIKLYDFCYPGGLMGRALVANFLLSFDALVQKIIVTSLFFVATILITRCAYLPLFFYGVRCIKYCCDRQKIPARIVIACYHVLAYIVVFLCAVFKKTYSVLTGNVIKNMQSSIVEFEQENHVDVDIDQVVQDLFWDEYIDVDRSFEQKSPSLVADHAVDEHVELFEDQARKIEDDPVKIMVSHQLQGLEEQEEPEYIEDKKSQQKAIEKFEKVTKEYKLPFLVAKKVEQKVLQEKQHVLLEQAKTLESKLAQFDIQGTVVGMHAGPVVTLFEYQPDVKVKVSRILSLEDDLAMALKALSIRIIAPIPGRSVVGFEVANQHRQDVVMARILESSEFKKNTAALPMIFGQDTFGNDFIADLAKMPHLLIAGSTGSGKSVALNAMLVSLLCSLKPSELQLIIIDPKRLEFAAYDGIAHLVFPIVTDTKKAIPILKWVVQTMEKRYEIMAKFGVRNLGDYKIAALKNKEMEPMPFMVGIIDELADLMMTAGKAVEDSIARIAQMARAAGIHMIIATQRPSVDVITGMIKVNLPNRVAFKVTSKIDSRTILDAGGAEKLLGRGDMLFLDASKSHLVRVHGAYISDQEIHDVVAQIKKQSKVHYLDIFEQFNNNDSNDLFDGDDELYQEIVQFIQELDEVSISMLQRRFRIGYNRSARLISILESKGLIMTVDGGKTRRVVK